MALAERDRGHLAQVATAENPRSAVDVEEHSGVIVRDAVRRDDVERARPEVTLLDTARERSGRISDHRTHESVGLGDIGLPSFGVVERWELPRWWAEPAHGQDLLSLLADGGGDRYLSSLDLNHWAIVQSGDMRRSGLVRRTFPGRERVSPRADPHQPWYARLRSGLRTSDAERRRAQLGGERSVAADLDLGCPLATGAEHGQLARVAGQGEVAAPIHAPSQPVPAK